MQGCAEIFVDVTGKLLFDLLNTIHELVSNCLFSYREEGYAERLVTKERNTMGHSVLDLTHIVLFIFVKLLQG